MSKFSTQKEAEALHNIRCTYVYGKYSVKCVDFTWQSRESRASVESVDAKFRKSLCACQKVYIERQRVTRKLTMYSYVETIRCTRSYALFCRGHSRRITIYVLLHEKTHNTGVRRPNRHIFHPQATPSVHTHLIASH